MWGTLMAEHDRYFKFSKSVRSHEAAMMSTAYNQRTIRSFCVGVAVLLAAIFAAPVTAQAQTGNDSQKPYIMILMDTSGSMEWTDEGDEEYPSDPVTNPSGDESGTNEWKSTKRIFPPGAEAYGPCYIWKPSCNDYERPAWTPSDEWTDAYTGSMSSELQTMQGDSAMRLSNASQPRHVTLKEILTGDMVMYRNNNSNQSIQNLSRLDDGPGCWFVPRQHDASAPQGEGVCEGDLDDFDEFPDHREPKPHFQEVFDGQHANGLMDTTAGNAIFGIAMFDGYKQSKEEPEKDWDAEKDIKDLNDSMKGGGSQAFAGLTEGEGDLGESTSGEEKKYNYNLGIYQILSPTDLDISISLADEISNYVQYALVDAGYLRDDRDKKLEPKKDEDDSDLFSQLAGIDLGFSEELDGFIDKYALGRQPVARATPLSAAIYDIHHYFAHGHKGKTDETSPIIDDPYMTCRPKHVVMMTDGYPEPELSGDGSIQVGGESLNSAFGYEADRYPYSWTEDAIYRFVHDVEYGTGNPRSGPSYLADSDWATDQALRFNPRVHIVGLQVGTPNDGDNETLEKQAIAKLAEMAIEGKTCAGQYLDDYKPAPYCETGPCCDVNAGDICLDKRQAVYMASRAGGDYNVPTFNEADPECEFPALVLTSNERDTMAQAFQRLFNSILSGGLVSRTRPTFVNRLDDSNITSPDLTDVTAEQGGQYRVFSGVQIDGDNPFWRGLLFRETLLCTKDSVGGFAGIDDGTYVPLHKQIDGQSGQVDNNDTVSADRRRIFTSFATEQAFDYTTNKPKSLDDANGGSFDRMRFIFGMDLASAADGTDEFGGTYLGATPTALVGGRIPFEITRMTEAMGNISQNIKDYFQVDGVDKMKTVVHEMRGRSQLKDGRALGAILNSSPVAVEPPDLDLPIDSYRSFKALHGRRPSMLYFATTDGLLHGVHAGELKDGETKADTVSVRTATSPNLAGGGSESPGSMHDQREAWAYIPQIIHKQLGGAQGKHSNLVDGTPVVKDVRLCHKNEAFNQNKQACRYQCPDDACLTQAQNNQWRTVLVAGLGQAGSGYFALDVTRPGGVHNASSTIFGIQVPDPAPLWEFDGNWERGQVETIGEDNPELVYPLDPTLRNGTDPDGDSFIDEAGDDTSGSNPYFWNLPFMGQSVGEAAIGTLAVNAQLTGSEPDRLRRPVAIFTAGGFGSFGPNPDRSERVGRAIYVVDMQTGTLLRRFVTYFDESTERRFKEPMTGSPALYNAFPGSLVTRGFVGDQAGRLYRIDLSDDEPSEWKVQLFFDPAESDDIPGNEGFGPASYKPALSLGSADTEGDLLIFYGLGERGDLSASGKTELMIGLREKIEVDFSSGPGESTTTSSYLWHVEFEKATYDGDGNPTGGFAEKLTGAPVIFNGGVYFTTYVTPGVNSCDPGWSRIYGMKYEGKLDTSATPPVLDQTPEGSIAAPPSGTTGGQGSNAESSDTSDWYYQPSSAPDVSQSVIIRGLAVTLGPVCSADPASTGGMQGSGSRQPTLVAQTSAAGDMPGDVVSSTGDDAALTSIEHQLPEPESQNIPLSWAVINK
jgi:hypothetical protein